MKDKLMHVIVAGSRSVLDYEYVKACLDNILGDEYADIIIISGTAPGADRMGSRWALQTPNAQLCEIPAQWDRYGKSAGFRRNEDMARIANYAIVFWDGESKGSSHMIAMAKRHDVMVKVLPATREQYDAARNEMQVELQHMAQGSSEEEEIAAQADLG